MLPYPLLLMKYCVCRFWNWRVHLRSRQERTNTSFRLVWMQVTLKSSCRLMRWKMSNAPWGCLHHLSLTTSPRRQVQVGISHLWLWCCVFLSVNNVSQCSLFSLGNFLINVNKKYVLYIHVNNCNSHKLVSKVDLNC